MQAWTVPGPTRFDGEFYHYKYLNPFPLPYQRPHPKIYIVGSGGEDTVQYAAEKGYGYSQVFTPIAAQLTSFENYRSTAVKYGHTPDSESIIISAIPYVAETEAKAIEEARDHIPLLFREPAAHERPDEHAAGLHAGRPAAQAAGGWCLPELGDHLGGADLGLSHGARHPRPGR